jgi:hypothetical protein
MSMPMLPSAPKGNFHANAIAIKVVNANAGIL